MKRTFLRFALPLVVLLPVPFFYNACRSNILGSSGFSSKSSNCKVALENGQLTKLSLDDSSAPSPFRNGKVTLRADAGGTRVVAKASGALELSQGERLSVVIDNKCLQENQADLSGQPISQVAARSGQLLNQLDRQAYEWVLDQDYTDYEIENQASNEACVLGVSWNNTYHVQSTALNDPNFSQQSHLTADRAAAAYDLFFNATGKGGGLVPSTGTPVIVAVIDTGVDYTHPDIKPNLWAHSQGYGIDITTVGTTQVSYNPYDVSTNGHGTHVAGMIAALGNNGVGIVGVMPWRAQVMAIKLFATDSSGNLSTTSTYFYNAMKFAYQNGAQVINLSLGAISTGAATDSVALAGVTEAVQHGVTVVTVIGNADSGNGQLIDGVSMSSIPGMFASIPGVIGVGAYDTTTGDKSYFSHYSTTFAEIGAPGEESQGTGLYSTLPVQLGGYGRLAGTSQAAPQVTGAAALTIGLIKNSYGVAPTPAEVERLILKSAVKSAQLAPYFKDGNKLDLTQLAQQINADYPNTRSPGSVGANCD